MSFLSSSTPISFLNLRLTLPSLLPPETQLLPIPHRCPPNLPPSPRQHPPSQPSNLLPCQSPQYQLLSPTSHFLPSSIIPTSNPPKPSPRPAAATRVPNPQHQPPGHSRRRRNLLRTPIRLRPLAIPEAWERSAVAAGRRGFGAVGG